MAHSDPNALKVMRQILAEDARVEFGVRPAGRLSSGVREHAEARREFHRIAGAYAGFLIGMAIVTAIVLLFFP